MGKSVHIWLLLFTGGMILGIHALVLRFSNNTWVLVPITFAIVTYGISQSYFVTITPNSSKKVAPRKKVTPRKKRK